MSRPIPRGVRPGDEPRGSLRRDPRPLTQQLTEGLKGPVGAGGAMIAIGVGTILAPALAHFALFIVGALLLLHLPDRRHRHLPMRLPKDAEIPDLNDPLPGRSKYRKAAGMVYLGNAVEYENEELWSGRLDELAHGLTLGTTGAGKTVLLTGRSANYIGLGGGLIYIDAKASPNLAWDIGAIAFRVGREDDIGVINYMTGNRTVSGANPARTSNTTNPFTNGSADSCVQMLASLIKEPEGDNAVFGERALAMVNALMYALVALRDGGHIDLSVNIIRDSLPLARLEQIAYDPRIDYRPVARDAVRAYLTSLPNYKPPQDRVSKDARTGAPKLGPDGKPMLDPIADQAGAQHGFAQMYFTRSMSSMTDTYGHIYLGGLPEIDFIDVVRRRRILIVMLPALEKSPAELSNLGKINLAAIRDAISTGLGSGVEGYRSNVLENLPTDSPIASKIICDEYGYMAVEGFSVVAAQARGLGFSVEWAGQDWAGIKRGSEKEAEQIWSNATLKTFGRLEDPEGFQKLMAAAGETRVAQVGSYSRQDMAYRESQDLGLEKQQRVDFVDLQTQIEGEVHLYWRGQLIRARSFYADVKDLPTFQINRYLRVGERAALPGPDDLPVVATETNTAGRGAQLAPSRDPRLPPTRTGGAVPDLMDALPPIRPRRDPASEPAPPPPVQHVPDVPPIPVQAPAPTHATPRSAPPEPTSESTLDASAIPPPLPVKRRPQRELGGLLAVMPDEDAGGDDGAEPPASAVSVATSTAPVVTASLAAAAPPEPQDDFGSWSTLGNLDDLDDTLDLHAIAGDGTRGHAALSGSIERALDSYPDAILRDVASDLSHELVSARLEAVMKHLLDEEPLDSDDDSDQPHP